VALRAEGVAYPAQVIANQRERSGGQGYNGLGPMRKRPVARASTKPKRRAFEMDLDYVRRERANVVYREARGKKPYAVLVPVDDDETVEAIEDLIDARAAERALGEINRKGEKPIPYERVRKELGLR
jgi:hypothetical protein